MKITLIIILFFATLFVSNTPKENISTIETATLIATPTPSITKEIDKKESPIKPIGDFMKVKTDGEHASGYSIELWKQDEKLYGIISVHRGLIGDPPAGLLENLQFDSKSGKLSFRAKVSLGLFFNKNYEGVPSHDVLEFDGIMTNRKIQGTLFMTNELCEDKCPVTKKISLPRSKEWSKEMQEYQTYAEWKELADMILNFRGPRW